MKKKNAGMTTIVVVCAMAIIMALALGLFLTVSVLMKSAEKTSAQQQCRILAVSLSEEITKQLTSEDKIYEDRISEEVGRVEDVHNISLWHYVKQNITSGTWPYYEEQGTTLHNEENAVRVFEMEPSGVASEIAESRISLYWIKGESEKIPSQLIVKTNITVKGQTCTITDTYELQRAGEEYETWKWKHVDKR